MEMLKAIDLLDKCVEAGILYKEDSCIAVYREASESDPEGWYLENIFTLARELIDNPEDIKLLERELERKQGGEL